MTNQKLLDLIDQMVDRFTPLAFKCECNGTDPSCAKVVNEDRYAIGTVHTLENVKAFLLNAIKASEPDNSLEPGLQAAIELLNSRLTIDNSKPHQIAGSEERYWATHFVNVLTARGDVGEQS